MLRQTSWSRRMALGLVIAFPLLVVGCSLIEDWLTEWSSPSVVRVSGVEQLCAWPSFICAEVAADGPAGIVAGDGDLLLVAGGSGAIFLYRETFGTAFDLEEQDDRLLLDGKTVSLNLAAKGKGWEWLRRASVEDLADLGLLVFDRKALDVDYTVLERLAAVRPHVGLWFDSAKDTDLVKIISLFEPEFLGIEYSALSTHFDDLVPRLTKLKKVLTSGDGPLGFLGRLPRLRGLVIVGEKSQSMNLSFLRGVGRLHELTLFGFRGVTDLSALATFSDLKKLDLLGAFEDKRIPDLAVLGSLTELAWLGFPLGGSQEAFNQAIATHPDLEVVAVPYGEAPGIHDLSPLRILSGLRAVMVVGKNVDVAPLHELKKLEYLGLPEDSFKGDRAEKTAALQNALPDTFVARLMPLCLGSGWILLLLPLVIMLRIVRARRQGLAVKANA